MSTYFTAEAALLTLIRAYSSGTVFTEANSSRDDWLVLDASGTEAAAVVEMASETREGDSLNGRQAHGAYQEVHQIGVWICVKRGVGAGGDSAAMAACKTLTEAVKDHLRPWERLNNATGVTRAQVVRTTEPSYISPTKRIEDATHVAQQIIVQIHCRAALNPVEVAGA